MSRLLSDNYLDSLPDAIVENLEALNDYVVQTLCAHIGKIGASVAHRLKSAIEYARADLGKIQKEIQRIATGASTSCVRCFIRRGGKVNESNRN